MYWGLIASIHYNYFFKSNINKIVYTENKIEIPATHPPTSTNSNVKTMQHEAKIAPIPTQKISRGDNTKCLLFKVTAYDLSVDSCGKHRSHKYFGITSSGYNLINHTRQSAMSIAVDINVIPMHSKVYVNMLNEKYKHMNGIYTARDTGGAVRGNIIDIFMGDFYSEKAHTSVLDFGIQSAYITVLE